MKIVDLKEFLENLEDDMSSWPEQRRRPEASPIRHRAGDFEEKYAGRCVAIHKRPMDTKLKETIMCSGCNQCECGKEAENLDPIIFEDALTVICSKIGLYESIITVGGVVSVAEVLQYYRKLGAKTENK